MEFRAQPLHLKAIIQLVSFLHKVQIYRYSAFGLDRYPYLALYSLKVVPPRRTLYWFLVVSVTLVSGHLSNHLLSYGQFLNALGYLLSTKQDLNRAIIMDIYRQYIQATYIMPLGSLFQRWLFMLSTFLT